MVDTGSHTPLFLQDFSEIPGYLGLTGKWLRDELVSCPLKNESQHFQGGAYQETHDAPNFRSPPVCIQIWPLVVTKMARQRMYPTNQNLKQSSP